MKKKAVTKFLANAGAIGMALSMMVTPVTAASAAQVVGVSGEQTDVAAAQTVTVSGLRPGSTVKLYQIVEQLPLCKRCVAIVRGIGNHRSLINDI